MVSYEPVFVLKLAYPKCARIRDVLNSSLPVNVVSLICGFYSVLVGQSLKAVYVLNSRVHCQESGEESSETESVHSLKCHISQEVNHLHEGLKHVSLPFT